MRVLKYANNFSSSPKQTNAISGADYDNSNYNNDMTSSSRNEIPPETTETEIPRQPRKRKSGLGVLAAVAENGNVETTLPPRAGGRTNNSNNNNNNNNNNNTADDSDIFSDAFSEAEDAVVGDSVADYRQRFHRPSLVERPPRPDYSFKVCIVGDVNVGKTSLLLTLTDDEEEDETDDGGESGRESVRRKRRREKTPKVGVGGRDKLVFSNAKRRTAKCRLEDTAGQERYKSLTSSFYRNCHGCLVVYDVTREETFNHVEDWFKDVRMYAEAEISVVLVAAHSVVGAAAAEAEAATEAEAEALARRRVVAADEGAKKAEKFEVPYVEANVRRGTEALAAMEVLVDLMIGKLERR